MFKHLLKIVAANAILFAALTGAAMASPTNPTFAGIWVKSNGSAWAARHGLSSDQYQAIFDQLVANGYRLVDVSGYSDKGQARYAAIWVKSSGVPWQARHGMTSAQYQTTFDQLVAQGYRLVKVSAYNVNGQARYAAIWIKAKGAAWQARHDLTADQYQATFDQLVAQGYRLTDVSGYNDNGEARYAAIWVKSSGAPWQARHGMTLAQFQSTFDQLVAQGYRLNRISGYSVNGKDRYAGIWVQANGPVWEARGALTSAQYQAKFDQLVNQGFRLTDVSGY